MKRKTLKAYPERTLRVCFKKNIRDFTYLGRTVHGSFESGKCYELPLETGTALIERGVASRVFDPMSVESILKEYSSSDLGRDYFEKHFDRQRILDHLRAKAESFWIEILGKNTCPSCKKAELRPKIAGNRFEIRFSCPACKKSHKKNVLGSQFPNWIISSTIHNFFQGKTPKLIYRSLKVESTNRYLDFYRLLIGDYGLTLYEKERIPKKSAILDIRKHFSQKLRTFNSFMMLLIGGVECKELLVDDVFIRRSWTVADKEKWKRTPESQRRELKSKRFSYMIVFVDKATRFIVNVYTALHRDSLNFNEAFRETREIIKGSLLALIGDMLAPQIAASKLTFSEDEVFHDFQVLNIKEKEERNIIERRIRDLRETLPKRQRYSSDEVLEQLANIAWTGQNYLNPMAVLDGQTPAQRIGIPYPFDSEKGSECQLSWNWRVFMIWVDWVFNHATEILAAGVK